VEKKKKKTPPDINQLAKSIVDQATSCKAVCETTTGDALPTAQRLSTPNRDTTQTKKKNPAAVALGRLGGLKGGKARADKLSAKKRKEIAQRAAQTRWQTKS
jgi:hypothetical protein